MKRDFTRLLDRRFDLLVLGGGIYGAWSAYDAALRGLNVAVIEQGDWASGTSSASSKLIHGGLRYLETMDFKLVRKSLAERQMLLDAAAHKVRALRFGIPVYRDSRIGSLRLRLGLALYDLLAGNVPDECKFRRFSAQDFSARFPFLETDGLLAGYSYLDAQTDDCRFVLEMIDGAQRSGAVCVNYCKAVRLLEKGGKAVGTEVIDAVTGRTGAVYAAQIVNAGGRWADPIQHESGRYRLSKGVHLLLPKTVSTEALLLTAKSDGRVFFMIPWYGLTLLGTTDTNYQGDPDAVSVEPDEVDYLLSEANRFLKHGPFSRRDIVGSFAGVRVLKRSADKSPTAVSRDWELVGSRNGLLTSIGGKFTSARADAEVIIDRVCARMGVTAKGTTFGKPFPWRPDGDYRMWKARQSARAASCGIDRESADWLLFRHGNRVDGIVDLCRNQSQLAERLLPDAPFIAADLVWCAQCEMAVHLDDLLRRRLPLLILAKMTPRRILKLAELVGAELGWDEDRITRECRRCLDGNPQSAADDVSDFTG